MAAVMLERQASRRALVLHVTTAGTHAVEGVPPGARTLSALRTVPGFVEEADGAAPVVAAHRSRQLDGGDLDRAELVVAMEAGHVRYLRRHHPGAAARTGTLRMLARELPPGPAPLALRVGALHLERARLDPADDVADPAGKDDAAYAACAAELWTRCAALVALL